MGVPVGNDSFVVSGMNYTDSGTFYYKTVFLTEDSLVAYNKCDSIATSATGGFLHTYSLAISRWYY